MAIQEYGKAIIESGNFHMIEVIGFIADPKRYVLYSQVKYSIEDLRRFITPVFAAESNKVYFVIQTSAYGDITLSDNNSETQWSDADVSAKTIWSMPSDIFIGLIELRKEKIKAEYQAHKMKSKGI